MELDLQSSILAALPAFGREVHIIFTLQIRQHFQLIPPVNHMYSSIADLLDVMSLSKRHNESITGLVPNHACLMSPARCIVGQYHITGAELSLCAVAYLKLHAP